MKRYRYFLFLLLSVAIFALVCPSYSHAAKKKKTSPALTYNFREFSLIEAKSDELTVCFWNVENLFDAEDDPHNHGDDEFVYTTEGNQWRRWTQFRYEDKLSRLAEIISYMKPDVLGLAELENRRVVEDLISVLKKKYNYDLPYISHRESPDFRGIDVGLISKFPIKNEVFVPNGSGRRETLVADIDCNGRALTVVVNHWKSKFGNEKIANELRTKDAKSIRRVLDKRLNENPATAIVFTGDFNDNLDCNQLTEIAMCSINRKDVASETNRLTLFNMASELGFLARASYYHLASDSWSSIDSMSVTRGMLPEVTTNVAPWQIHEKSYQIIRYTKHLSTIGSPIPYRRQRSRLFSGYYSGYSDHFPIRLILRPSKQKNDNLFKEL